MQQKDGPHGCNLSESWLPVKTILVMLLWTLLSGADHNCSNIFFFHWRCMRPKCQKRKVVKPQQNLLKICQCPGWRGGTPGEPTVTWSCQRKPVPLRGINESRKLLNVESYAAACEVDYYAAQRFWAKHQKYHTTNLCLICMWHLEVDNKKPCKLICNQNWVVLIDEQMNSKVRDEHQPDMFINYNYSIFEVGELGGLSCLNKQFQVCWVLSFAQISLWSNSEHCSWMLSNIEQIRRMHRPRFLLFISGCVFSFFRPLYCVLIIVDPFVSRNLSFLVFLELMSICAAFYRVSRLIIFPLSGEVRPTRYNTHTDTDSL